MTDLEQRIREAYDAQHASERSADARWPFSRKSGRGGRMLLLLRCIAPPCGVARECVSSLLGRMPFARAGPSSVPMACIVRRLLSWTLR